MMKKEQPTRNAMRRTCWEGFATRTMENRMLIRQDLMEWPRKKELRKSNAYMMLDTHQRTQGNPIATIQLAMLSMGGNPWAT